RRELLERARLARRVREVVAQRPEPRRRVARPAVQLRDGEAQTELRLDRRRKRELVPPELEQMAEAPRVREDGAEPRERARVVRRGLEDAAVELGRALGI